LNTVEIGNKFASLIAFVLLIIFFSSNEKQICDVEDNPQKL
jgi:hypothetical protein